MSDIIGFLFGIVCGFSLAVVLFSECVKAGKHEASYHRLVRTVNTSKHPQWGTGNPRKTGNNWIRTDEYLVNVDDPNFRVPCPEPFVVTKDIRSIRDKQTPHKNE